MIGSPTRKSLENRLRRVHAAVLEFRRALETECSHEFLLLTLKDKQLQLWRRLGPRLARIQADATQGCDPSLRWIGGHLDELGYVLAHGELLERSVRATETQSAEAAAAWEARRKQAQRERDAYQLAANSRELAATLTKCAPPRAILQHTEVARLRRDSLRQEAASTPPPCEHGVGSEAWRQELERVRQQGMPKFAGVSRSEDVIPRK